MPRTSGLSAPLLLSAAAVAALAAYRYAEAKRAERETPPHGRFVEADGVRLHYVDRGMGDGPPVVILHGNGATIEDIEASGLFGAILAQGRRVIAFDRPGFGHTRRPRGAIWSPQAQARLIGRALDRLGVSRAIVAGHSWGALTAAALGVVRPDLVGGLLLLSGYYYPSPRKDVALFSLTAIPGLGDLFRYTVGPGLSRAMGPVMLEKIFEPQPVPARFFERYPLRLAHRPVQMRAASEDTAFMIPGAAALADRYREIDAPTVIMAGDQDRIVTTSEQSEVLARDIEGSELRLLPGLGHMIHYFATDAIAEQVEALERRMAAPHPAPGSMRAADALHAG